MSSHVKAVADAGEDLHAADSDGSTGSDDVA
jgi:hypothetical protein